MKHKPVAWINRDEYHGWLNWDKNTEMPINIPLYTQTDEHSLGIAEAIGFEKGYKASHPVKELTLTDEDILEEWTCKYSDCYQDTLIDFARAILRKASEK